MEHPQRLIYVELGTPPPKKSVQLNIDEERTPYATIAHDGAADNGKK